ncbi:plasmid partitioning protein RepA [Gemmobacter lutimaris]|nr:plasmid partitioning protein RepA [Gemmobacter lutimaris]
MRARKGCRNFQAVSDRVVGQLKGHGVEIPLPHTRKTLRKFAMREAADFLRINQNTFRHYISTLRDRLPTGEMDKNNRRYFTAEEVHEIQRGLFEAKKIDPKVHPRRRRDEPCVAITFLTVRKGSGTSVLSAHVAANLSLLGYRVLFGDLDPQASITNMFGVTPELDPDMPTAYDVIRHMEPVPARDVIQKTFFPNLDLIPASMSLMEFEYETALSSRTPSTAGAFHTRIANALEPILPDYDVIIFDAPPQLGLVVAAALFASRGVLIPLNASMLDVMSLTSFLSMAGNLMEVVEGHAPEHGFDFVKHLITRYKATDKPQVQAAGFLRTALGDSVMTTEFVESTAIMDATAAKQTLLEVEPRGTNRKTYDRAIESIRQITAEIEAEIFQVWGRTARS